MSNELVINVTYQETRVALLESGHLAELFIERKRERVTAGSICKGKVIRVLPGMQAAFVDIGLEKAAFLYVGDFREGGFVDDEDDDDRRVRRGGGRRRDEDEEHEVDVEGEEEGEEAHVAAGVAAAGARGGRDRGRRTRRTHGPMPKIEEVLKEGQEILVQVAKEPIGTKGARITSHISLPGRHLVFLPTVDHIGISRRIRNEKERRRLRDIVMSIKPPGGGFIVRTVSEGKSEEELTADMTFLLKLWNTILKKTERVKAPAVLHYDLDVTFRAIRDLFSAEVDRLVVDSKEEYDRILEFVTTYHPELRHQIDLYEGVEPIFDHYGIEVEIQRALARRVWLKSGGYILVDTTEALTAIDVNTGRFVGKRNLDETILRTNLEAVEEIAYQLRLRNIGGIIILDFIDMEKHSEREKVFHALEEALRKDKAKTNILKISELGLVQMTRKRTRESLLRLLTETCPHCEGRGVVKSKTTICYDIFREILRASPDIKGPRIVVKCHPSIGEMLVDEERGGIEQLERRLGKQIAIVARKHFHPEQYEVDEAE
ncbi:MAG TPA: Rne/Rng family ribonuclease [Thermodesulfobacteriota bacterium]